MACALAPCLWVTLEFARTHLPIIGFPWNLTGYAAGGNLALLQLTPITGIYGLTFLIAGYGSLLAYALMRKSQRVWKSTLVVTALLVIIAAVGGFLVPKAMPDHVARLVQTNFPQSEHYPADWLQIHAGELDQLEHISVDAAKRGTVPGENTVRSAPGLIIWPEVPAPFSLQDPAFAQRATRIAREAQSYFLVGVIDWKLDAAHQYYATNTALLLNPQGWRVFTYDKIHLVPFGEYVPLRNWIKFAGRLTADISDFTPGTEYRVGQLPGLAGTEGGSWSSGASAGTGDKFGTFICYEAIFPDEVRRFAENGADLLINISNDGWFGRSSAPPQHLMMARVRAVENRRWLLRDTNNGYTVDIDPYGHIVASMPTDIRGELDAPFAFRTDTTLYTRFGDWFSWLCVLVSATLLGVSTRKVEKGAGKN